MMNRSPLLLATIVATLGTLVLGFTLTCILENELIAQQFVSAGLWARLIEWTGGDMLSSPGEQYRYAEVNFGFLLMGTAFLSTVCWLGGAAVITRKEKTPFSETLSVWGLRGWGWSLLLVAFLTAWFLAPPGSVFVFLLQSAPLWFGLTVAGWLGTFAALLLPPKTSDTESSPRRLGITLVVVGVLIYVLTYTAMNWQLYRNLLVPHGDSGMYEEHLWNLTHGKGFRSYLEDRLFLGEHIQVIHILLLPLHWLWPSLMMMDLAESLALASGALPIYWMTFRHTKSWGAACLMSLAYLMYFPLHYLDISIDFKTFRPIAFGVPAMLFGLDQWERGRLKTAGLCAILALAAKEDYAIVLAPIGLWIAIFDAHESNTKSPTTMTKNRWIGLGFMIFSTCYLFGVVKFAIPYFRDGQEVHYVGYFQKFGSSLDEVIKNLTTNPSLLFSVLITTKTFLYAGMLLAPVGFIAAFSPSRLATAAPLFLLLCLNELSQSPIHHFHAPIVPLVFWGAIAGLNNFASVLSRVLRKDENATPKALVIFAAWLIFFSARMTSLFSSMSPLGIGFWDPDSAYSWKKHYVINERAKAFEVVPTLIPESARVFATDFPHTRLTHFHRSYDYSDYPRHTDRELVEPIPGEEYYLVIDTQHRYSKIHALDEIPEYRENPDAWEILPDRTDGYFLILKRKPIAKH